MSYVELSELPDLKQIQDRWVAIDPRGGQGLYALRSGAVVVDFDPELDELCRRISDARATSLTIVYCGDRPHALHVARG